MEKNMEEVERVFKHFDSNGDGKISCTEFGDIIRALGSDTSPDEVKQMMEEVDTDGDGFIDLKEFGQFFYQGGGGGGGSDGGECLVEDDGSGSSSNEELREAFDIYDKDKNGLISATELHMVLKSLGEKCTFVDCCRMISSVDSDGDGSVNFDEFKKMMTNGNGNSNSNSNGTTN